MSKNILAVNDQELTRQDFYEFVRATQRDRTIWFSALVYICAAIIYAFGIASKATGDPTYAPGTAIVIIITVCVLLMFLIRYALPLIPARKHYNAYVENKGNRVVSVFYSDRVERRAGVQPIRTFYYKDLKRAIVSTNLLVLVFSDRSSILVRKDAFRGGTLEEILVAVKEYHEKIESIKPIHLDKAKEEK